MSLRSDEGTEPGPARPHPAAWRPGGTARDADAELPARGDRRETPRMAKTEAARMRGLIEAAVGDVFGVPRDRLATPSRGKAPVARARQAAMYLAHVSCGLTLTDVGHVFARDRTTVAHACSVIEDHRDDPPFDRALELLEWIVPTLVRPHVPSIQS